MYNPDDKDIDRLSREAAEHYHAPGTPSWETLRQTLDKELPQEKEKKRRGFLFFFLLFAGLSLAGTSIWYGIHTSNSKTVTTITKSNTDQSNQSTEAKQLTGNSEPVVTSKPAELPADAAGSKSPDNVTKNKTSSRRAPTALVPISTKAAEAGKKTNDFPVMASNAKKLISKPEPSDQAGGGYTVKDNSNKNPRLNARNIKEDADLDRTNNSPPVARGKSHRNRQPLKDNTQPVIHDETSATSVADAVDKGNASSVPNGTNETVIVPADTARKQHLPVKDLALQKHDSVAKETDTAKPAVAKTKPVSKSEKAILFGVTAGFDFSTVKFSYGSNAGYNIGVMGGYQFNKHWAVITGVTYTKKNYKLNGSDYHPPKHDWTQYVDLQQVDGFCRMWEIPLNARYTFNPSAKNVFFGSAGLSSYIMKKQQYDYYYKNNMGMPMVAPWHNDSTFNHIFSILNLSLGLQKPVSKHLDLLIEPYARIPLGGVGFGNIRLSSFGVNLTVQYKKSLKR